MPGQDISRLTEGFQQELAFWSAYASHVCEVEKQTYALSHMGIEIPEYVYNLSGKSILEIGAGPTGVSLRCVNGRRKIIEPLDYPRWVWERYEYFGVEYDKMRVEDMDEEGWDEVWVLNVLQHIDDLDLALQKIKQSAKVLRIFEWLDIPADTIHKQVLQKNSLDKMLGIHGNVVEVNEPYMYNANAYVGYFNLTTEGARPGLHRKWGGDLHRAMIHYISNMGKSEPLIGAEIGVLAGLNTAIILAVLNIDTLYLIDPYTIYDTDTYTQEQLNTARQTAVTALAPYQDKIVWVPFSSQDAAKYLADAGVQLDFAYIDGDHAYQPVLDDIAAYMPLVKADGVIGGHDFIDDIAEPNRYIQVKSAVFDYSQQYGIPFYSCDFEYSDWWIDKSQLETPNLGDE